MDVDSTLIVGGVTFIGGLATVVLGYGELKTKVVSVTQRANSAQEAREKLFERVNELEQETRVQRSEIDALRKENSELFRLHEKSNENMSNLNATLQGLSKDVHFIKDFIKNFRNGSVPQ